MHTLDIAPLRSESPPQKRSGMARVLKGFHSFTCTPTRSSAIGMSHACLYPGPERKKTMNSRNPSQDFKGSLTQYYSANKRNNIVTKT